MHTIIEYIRTDHGRKLCMLRDTDFSMFLEHGGRFVATISDSGSFDLLNPEMDPFEMDGEVLGGPEFRAGQYGYRTTGAASEMDVAGLESLALKTLFEFSHIIEDGLSVFGEDSSGVTTEEIMAMIPPAHNLDDSPSEEAPPLAQGPEISNTPAVRDAEPFLVLTFKISGTDAMSVMSTLLSLDGSMGAGVWVTAEGGAEASAKIALSRVPSVLVAIRKMAMSEKVWITEAGGNVPG